MKAVIDTNIILVANGQHTEASPECVINCIHQLTNIKEKCITVIDDAYRILGEYQNKTTINPAKGAGDIFLKWLLRNIGNTKHVEQVSLTEEQENWFSEFNDCALQEAFDPPDRKFVAVAFAHSEKPKILQAVDCKWLDWSACLKSHGIAVDFICLNDAQCFYRKKFPNIEAPNPYKD